MKHDREMSFSDINCRLKCAPSRALEEIQLSRVSVCVSLYMQIRLSLMPLRTASVVIKWEQKNYFSFQFSFNLRGISRESENERKISSFFFHIIFVNLW